MRSTGTVVGTSVRLCAKPSGVELAILPAGSKIEVVEGPEDDWPLVFVASDADPKMGYVLAAAIQWDDLALPSPVDAGGNIVFTGRVRVSRSRLYMMITGELAVPDCTGVVHTFKINTGGYGASYRKTDGPTPPGTYGVAGPFLPRPGGMTIGLVGFRFDLLPNQVQVPQGDLRGGFCIHPDGPPPGTLGCLGISEAEDNLLTCKTLIADLIVRNPRVKVVVTYDSGVLF